MTSKQIKDLIRNQAKKNNIDAQILLRNYMLERLLEKISLSKFKRHFILKGGMLVAAMVGLDVRSTVDMDATFRTFVLYRFSAFCRRRVLKACPSCPYVLGYVINFHTNNSHAYDYIRRGQTITLIDAKCCGVINRIWMTMPLRCLKAEQIISKKELYDT